MQSLTGTGSVQAAPLNLESKGGPGPGFPAMCAEVILACESLRSTYFPILFPILSSITPPRPIAAFQPFLTLLSLRPKGSELPTGRKDSSLHRGKETWTALMKPPKQRKDRADSCLFCGWSKPLLHQPNAGAAWLMLWWSEEANPEPWSPRLLPNNCTLSFSMLHLLVLSLQEHVSSLYPVNMTQCRDLLWVCCLLREISCFCQMSYVQGICAAVIYLYGN